VIVYSTRSDKDKPRISIVGKLAADLLMPRARISPTLHSEQVRLLPLPGRSSPRPILSEYFRRLDIRTASLTADAAPAGGGSRPGSTSLPCRQAAHQR
jgi:hypothetical protein